jgi:RimJ/RimL family protein N-acetyltransferase
MILKGKKVILRPIKMSDAPRFVKWLNDREVYQYLQAHDRRLTLKKELKWIKQNLKDLAKKNFAIETLEHQHIGSVSLDVNKENNRAIFGIFIGDRNYWNRGCGTDAARTIINYGFSTLKLHRVELDVMIYNERAIKVYKRLGFKLEGRLRDRNRYLGKFYDVLRMSILEREWKKKNNIK